MSLLNQLEYAFYEVRWFGALPFVVGAAVPWVVALGRIWFQARSAQKLSAEAAFNEALSSDDLGKLSSYLRDEFGKVSLAIYLSDEELRARLDKYLARLTEFVAPPVPEAEPLHPNSEQADHPSAAPVSPPPQPVPSWEEQPTDPPQIVAALQSARNGESWNALARLRRDLEGRFRAELVGTESGTSRIPMKKVPVPAEAKYVFRRFYRTAGRAIHGEDVTDEEVIQAIQDARVVYRAMEQLVPGWSNQPVPVPPTKRRVIF
ncbi:hypothetical protein [Bradyrhizobium liaoningense]|uniref:hypothetical protein n=1 Tax=Bradyrhizobium liaoningense TaxID=43992 RepID=UPI001BA88872|nr:hypothetical protein [Bradyrhizobium liaoningense]MBR0820233.1 hypothetical protein [Bradyrhizobium liaoningense]